MVNESIAIMAVLMAAVFTTVKAKKAVYAILILPIFSVPIFYFIYKLFEYAFSSRNYSATTTAIVFVVIGGILGSLVSFVLSHFIPTNKGKIGYTVLGTIFSLGLMLAYMVNLS